MAVIHFEIYYKAITAPLLCVGRFKLKMLCLKSFQGGDGCTLLCCINVYILNVVALMKELMLIFKFSEEKSGTGSNIDAPELRWFS